MNDHCPNAQGAYFSPVAPPEYCLGETVNTVPEPSSLVLVLLAVAVLAAVRRV
jgi:hypothetical protein